ncbi:MAG TPA: molybdenum cofactor biosynthesis protein MoaE [Candidatus Paceibacterota bacterium]|nr:molybdenum cofactor biosynthesis protein MoaE [Verrucomicrobiota bacterium]HRY48791.1 molybdenum cofactor biosynthesis protein MoaE [Candidatus Paceibacterota bacterium]HRZ99477.1 molybdenum cofactor biosynthesis protein MoaE [Candidatus Paceibacterota bacterium]
MQVRVLLTGESIAATPWPLPSAVRGTAGAWVEFRGIVRGQEQGHDIPGLFYEAYAPMAEKLIRQIAEEIGRQNGCLALCIIHRLGWIPVGETAVYVGVAAPHRREAFSAVIAFMDRLKEIVPIWKLGASEPS